MDFPISLCPTCGLAGMSMTSLTDTHYKYICTSLDCPNVGEWTGGKISKKRKKEGLEKLDALAVSSEKREV